MFPNSSMQLLIQPAHYHKLNMWVQSGVWSELYINGHHNNSNTLLNVHTHKHSHIYTHTTCTCLYLDRQNWLYKWLGGEPAGGNRTGCGDPVGSGTPALHIFSAARTPQCSGVLIYGLVTPMRRERWGTSLSDSFRISVLDSWA